MSNIIEYIFKLKNDASSHLDRITRDSDRAIVAFEKIEDEIEQLDKELAALENRSPDKMRSYFGGIGDMIPDLLKNPIAMIAGAAGIADAINQGLRNSQSKIELGNLLGKESGQELYNSLKDVKAIFGDETFDFGKKVLNSGVAVDDVTKRLRQYGEVANGDKGATAGLVDSFAEMRVEGKFTEEVFKKLGVLGFNPLAEISRTTGQSMASLQQRMQEGRIGVNEIEKALETATSQGGKFHGNLDAINASPIGKWNIMITKVQEYATSLGEMLMPVISTVVDYGLRAFDWLAEKISIVVEWLKPMFAWVNENKDILLLLASVIAAVVVAIQAVTAAKAIWIAVTGGLTTAIEVMSTAIMNIPVIGWILAGIAAIIAAIMYLRNTFTGFGKFFANLWEIAKAHWTLFVNNIKAGFEMISYIAESVWLRLKSFGQFVAQLFSNISEAISLAKEFKFEEAKAKLTATITTEASKEIQQLDKDHADKQRNLFDEILAAQKTIAETPLKGLIKRKEDEADPNAATNRAFGSKSTADMSKFNNQKASEGLNAITGGGVKNITVTIGKLIEKSEIHIARNEDEKAGQDLEKIVLETLVRVTASAQT